MCSIASGFRISYSKVSKRHRPNLPFTFALALISLAAKLFRTQTIPLSPSFVGPPALIPSRGFSSVVPCFRRRTTSAFRVGSTSRRLSRVYRRLKLAKIIINRDSQILLRTKISFRRLNGAMPKQKLDLFQISAVLATELCAGASQIMRPESFDPNLLCGLLDDRPNRPIAQLVTNQLPALGKRPQQAAVLYLGRDHPGVNSVLDPERNRHGADSAALPTKIGQDPLPSRSSIASTSRLASSCRRRAQPSSNAKIA
jgi:hypothetical protein